MAGFNREEMSRCSKAELLDYIEQQQDQLSRFETRFRDVVRAYKSVLKEKEALEASIRAISSHTGGGGGGGGGGTGEGEGGGGEEGVEGGWEGRPPDDVESGREVEAGRRTDESETEEGHMSEVKLSPEPKEIIKEPSVSTLKQQLATLTSALATFTEEKSKMEANFQMDKRTMLAQQDSLTKQLQAERERADSEIMRLQQLFEETQRNLRAEQMSREEEQNTHAEMLRELQMLITSERDDKEAFRLQLHEAEMEIQRLHTQIAEDRTREYEERVHALSRELEDVRHRLQAAERQAAGPSPLLLQLQSEMAEMKEEHLKSLIAEQQRANEAEERLRAQAQREEQRVASLESKLSELSATVGNYDRQRELDFIAIQKLKERVTQLDSENTALTRAHVERQESFTLEQVSGLQERIARLKAFLKIATLKISEKAALPTNVEELSVSDYAELLSSEPSRKEFQQELFQLKDEFERYKMRAQSVLKSRGSKEVEVGSKELKELQTRNNEFQSRVDALERKCEEGEERLLVQMQRHREEIRGLSDKLKQESAAVEAQYKQKLHELQQHIQLTRERTLKLLAEKETEIQHLRSEIAGVVGVAYSLKGAGGGGGGGALERSISHGSVSSQQGAASENNDSSSEQNHESRPAPNLSIRSTESTSAVQELLEQPSPAASSEARLFHFVQEQHRRDNELTTARRKRLELEDTVRELQEREGRHLEQNTLLKEEIRKLGRDRSRETENLEYLKNVIIHFMSADSTGREQMITPIATILHFSPEEVLQIKKKMAARRWLPRKT